MAIVRAQEAAKQKRLKLLQDKEFTDSASIPQLEDEVAKLEYTTQFLEAHYQEIETRLEEANQKIQSLLEQQRALQG